MAQREGYLLLDHQASPGLPVEVAERIGLDPNLVREGKIYEAATKTCAHCKGTVVLEPRRTRERASCMKCGGKYICDYCANQARLPGYVHIPFAQKVDNAMEDRLRDNVYGLHVMGSPMELLTKKG